MTATALNTPNHPTTELLQAQLFDYPVHLVSSQQGLERLSANIDEGRNFRVITLNPEMIMQADRDADLAQVIINSDLVIPDGAGVVWALKTRGYQVERLPGIEFSEEVFKLAAMRGYRVAIVGSSQPVLDQARQRLCEKYPGLNIVYTHKGFFESPEERSSTAEACAETHPQVVFVGLGVPRQEKWISDFASRFSGTAFIGVGGSLDVWSGITRRAPAWMRTLNLEWLYRISTEPHRLKRVYISLPMFVVKVLLSRQ